MEKSEIEQISEILNKNLSEDELKKALDKIIIKGSCERKYYSENEFDSSCDSLSKKRGVVEYYNCDDPSDNRKYYGEWHCT